MSPSGKQMTLGEGGAPSIELAEQGFYSVRLQGTGERRPFEVAVNLDPAESDLTPLEPTQFVATVTGRAAVTRHRQSLEHPGPDARGHGEETVDLVVLCSSGALMALLTEAILSNRLSAKAAGRFAAALSAR